jgi:(2Fe-2S) ferredoxin
MATRYTLSICQGPDCTGNGAEALISPARAALKELGLEGRCTLKRGGCYGLCEQGANAVVRVDLGAVSDPFAAEDFELTHAPGETHYAGLDAEKIRQVIAEHVGQDRPVEALRGEPQG